jgi:hypothetical protein
MGCHYAGLRLQIARPEAIFQAVERLHIGERASNSAEVLSPGKISMH